MNHVMVTLSNPQQRYDPDRLLSQAEARKQMIRCPQVLCAIAKQEDQRSRVVVSPVQVYLVMCPIHPMESRRCAKGEKNKGVTVLKAVWGMKSG
jgi:hypothetical protein